MGGRPKGWLAGPDGRPLLERLATLGAALGLETVLIGDASPYDGLDLGLEALPDETSGVGPIGGLATLLARAGNGHAIALSCDLPFVTEDALRALVEHPSDAPIVAGRRDDDAPFEPFFARYEAATVLPVVRARITRGEHGLQGLFAILATEAHRPWDPRTLDDWDEPADVERAFDPPPHRG